MLFKNNYKSIKSVDKLFNQLCNPHLLITTHDKLCAYRTIVTKKKLPLVGLEAQTCHPSIREEEAIKFEVKVDTVIKL